MGGNSRRVRRRGEVDEGRIEEDGIDEGGSAAVPIRKEPRVIPAAFDYVRAGSAEEAIKLLGEYGDEAKLLAGGHSLLPLMKLRLATPSVLVDVSRLTDLSYVRDDGDTVAIGGLTRHHDVEHNARLREQVPLLAAAAGEVGD